MTKIAAKQLINCFRETYKTLGRLFLNKESYYVSLSYVPCAKHFIFKYVNKAGK